MRDLTMFTIKGSNIDKVEIKINLHGKHIGDNFMMFSTYLGIVIGDLIPITYKD